MVLKFVVADVDPVPSVPLLADVDENPPDIVLEHGHHFARLRVPDLVVGVQLEWGYHRTKLYRCRGTRGLVKCVDGMCEGV